MRLIDADALKKDFDNLHLFKTWVKEEIKTHIDNAPTVEPEPIGDYQKRALEIADNLKDKGVINNRERGTLRRAILLEPERPQGEWIDHGNNIECDQCHVWFLKDHLIRKSFCPNCGAEKDCTKLHIESC